MHYTSIAIRASSYEWHRRASDLADRGPSEQACRLPRHLGFGQGEHAGERRAYFLDYIFGHLQEGAADSIPDLVYNLVDLVNKIVFCLAICASAKTNTLELQC